MRRARPTHARFGRIPTQPFHVTDQLPEEERDGTLVVEHHLWLRGKTGYPSFEVLDDGTVGVFLTDGHVQWLLRRTCARRTGEHYAAHIINDVLPRLGLIEDTGLVKKPSRARGRARKRTDESKTYWWRIFRLPALTRLLTTREGAYPRSPGNPGRPPVPPVLASLSALLRRQGLIRRRTSSKKLSKGSVQWAFAETGPP